MPSAPAPNRLRVDRFSWNRDYFRDRTPLARARWWLSLVAFALSLGWIVVGLGRPTEAQHLQVSHGPVAGPHAAWEQRCDACHAPHSLDEISPRGLLNVQARWNDFHCETCHSGPVNDPKNFAPHHADAVWQPEAPLLECSACHRDHRGRDFSMVKLHDKDCTQCHQQLREHHLRRDPQFKAEITRFEADHPEFKGEITRFEADHPEFKVLEKEKKFKRTLNFSHAHHMMKGIPPTPEAENHFTNAAIKLDDIPVPFRERYRLPGQVNADPVQLSCSSCHQLDAGRSTAEELQRSPHVAKAWQATENLLGSLPRDSVLPPRAAGAYYLPVNYETSCQACHPIQVGIALETDEPLKLTLPHRLRGDALDKQVRLSVISEMAKQKSTRVLLKENRDRLDPLDDGRRKQLKNLDDKITELSGAAKKQLFLASPAGEFGCNCAKCHQIQQADGPSFAIIPPTEPAIWLPHAKFNHAAHRAMACASCHEDKTKKINDISAIKTALANPEPVGIPGIDNCRQCHAPPGRVEVSGQWEPRGGVRHGCVDCHRYHNGDAPLHGLGSPRRDPPDADRLNSAEFLRGIPKGGHP